MAALREFRTGFDAGFIDPDFIALEDADLYRKAATDLHNVEIAYSGAVSLRRGCEFLKGPEQSIGTRVEAFTYSEDFEYIIDMTPGTLFVRDVDGVEVGQFPSTTWITAENLWEIRFTQLIDVLIFTHHDFFPKQLTRTLTGWTLEDFSFATYPTDYPIYQPYRKFDDAKHIYMQPSAETGTITVTTCESNGAGGYDNVDDYWHTDHIGVTFRYKEQSFTVTSLDSDPAIANAVVNNPLPLATILTMTTDNNDPFVVGEPIIGVETGTLALVATNEAPGANTMSIDIIGHGMFKAAIGSPGGGPNFNEIVEADRDHNRNGQIDYRSAGTAPVISLDWEEPAFSVTRGYPAACAFASGRLWFASTPSVLNYIWGSKALDFFNFDVGNSDPDDAIAVPLVGDAIRAIYHLSDGPQLGIFTDSNEYWVPESENNPITPSSFNPKRTSGYGSSKRFRPVSMGNIRMFMQQHGNALHAFYFNWDTQNYATPIISEQASSLLSNVRQGFSQTGVSSRGEEYLWLVNEDGTATQLISLPEERRSAFVKWTHPFGKIISGCATDKNVYLVVEDPSGTRYLERLDSKATDSIKLDSYETLPDVAKSVWDVHTRYDNETVDVVMWHDTAGPVYHLGSYPVVAGQIDVSPYTPAKISVGFRYSGVAETTPLNVWASDGNTRMLPKKLVSHMVSLLNTYSVTINGRELTAWSDPADPVAAPVPITGDRRNWQLGWDPKQTVRIEMLRPLPATVLAIQGEVAF